MLDRFGKEEYTYVRGLKNFVPPKPSGGYKSGTKLLPHRGLPGGSVMAELG